jgi:phosphoenolpyruvate synthase/pyruvate phosphate dikinase
VRNGFPTPPGFVVPADVYLAAMDHAKLRDLARGATAPCSDYAAEHTRRVLAAAEQRLLLDTAIVNAS